MLYTTYLANLKNLPKEENNLCILGNCSIEHHSRREGILVWHIL